MTRFCRAKWPDLGHVDELVEMIIAPARSRLGGGTRSEARWRPIELTEASRATHDQILPSQMGPHARVDLLVVIEASTFTRLRLRTVELRRDPPYGHEVAGTQQDT
jgi:hypothetical protein